MKKYLNYIGAFLLLALFIGLNRRAYDGFFDGDELDNLTWAPGLPNSRYLLGLISPLFEGVNFRPAGHFYFALLGRLFGLDFPPFMTPVFALHFLNGFLLHRLLRRLEVPPFQSLAGAAFFLLSVSAMDAYWKPMYIFDLLCATFCLTSLLLYAQRRWLLSFLAFWLAYKSKEPAVMLPAVLLLYEVWFGRRKFAVLIPFFLVSLSFGLQGIFLHPNHDPDYTFRFTPEALGQTLPFYAGRFLGFPGSGLLLLPLLRFRDRRVWFGLASLALLILPVLFLPGRRFEAYAYLPLTGAVVALSAAAAHASPRYAWLVLALWMPWNLSRLHYERHEILIRDEGSFAFVSTLQAFAAANPSVQTLVYDKPPESLHNWGVSAAWTLVHPVEAKNHNGLRALYIASPEGVAALRQQEVALARWYPGSGKLGIRLATPLD